MTEDVRGEEERYFDRISRFKSHAGLYLDPSEGTLRFEGVPSRCGLHEELHAVGASMRERWSMLNSPEVDAMKGFKREEILSTSLLAERMKGDQSIRIAHTVGYRNREPSSILD